MNEAEFQNRLSLILAFHRACPGLEAAVMPEVNAFFAEHPAERRSEFTAGLVANLIFERQKNHPLISKATPKPTPKAA